MYLGVCFLGIKYTTFDYNLKCNINAEITWFYSKIEAIAYLMKFTGVLISNQNINFDNIIWVAIIGTYSVTYLLPDDL